MTYLLILKISSCEMFSRELWSSKLLALLLNMLASPTSDFSNTLLTFSSSKFNARNDNSLRGTVQLSKFVNFSWTSVIWRAQITTFRHCTRCLCLIALNLKCHDKRHICLFQTIKVLKICTFMILFKRTNHFSYYIWQFDTLWYLISAAKELSTTIFTRFNKTFDCHTNQMLGSQTKYLYFVFQNGC